MSGLRNFEPGGKWSNDDHTLTDRAQGWMRQLFDYIGARVGVVPVTSAGGDGVTTTTFWREDGNFAVPDYPVGADPTATVGTTAINGTASTFLRSDAAQALNVTISPTWSGTHTFSNSLTANGGVIATTMATTGAFGCNAATPQTSATIGASVVTTAATNVVPYGYVTQAQADDIVTRLNTIRAALIANGILV